MTFMKYVDWNPTANSLNLVQHINEIIVKYEKQGYTLTIRQIYYQLVTKILIENTKESYQNLIGLITKARKAGLMSWTAIEDRNRSVKSFWFEENERELIRKLPLYLRYDYWAWQDTYIEVWVEKDALENVTSRACNRKQVIHMACKGYLSSSEAWRAGLRFQEKIQEGKKCVLIHLGDHDPSGLDMTRDNSSRVDLFSETKGKVEIRRIALNRDQIELYKPPPNPAKVKDSRSKAYIAEHGNTSWELDALEPRVLEKLITDEIDQYIDWTAWSFVTDKERESEARLSNLHSRWDEIKKVLDNG